jgi:hypothetical protein
VELLSSIFRLSKAKSRPHLGTIDIHHQNLSVVRLTRVCQLWRAVAIQDSTLWSNISFSTSRLSTIRCATEFLRRSRGATLKVQVIDIPNAGVAPYCALVTDLVEELAQQSHRVVEFEAVGFSKLVAEALVLPANNLSRLTINGQDSEELSMPFGGLMPRLERLTLSNPSGWSLGLFPDITKVTLFCSGNNLGMGSLVDFLDGARNLEVLSLSRYQASSPPGRKIVRKPVTLPRLRELNLSFSDSSQILGCLDLPPSAHVSILAGPEPKNRDIFQCLPNAPGFWRFLSDTQTLSVTLHPSDNEFYLSMCGRDKPSCFLRVYDDRKQLDERWILRSVHVATRFEQFFNVESLSISVENYPIPWRAWLAQLDRLVRMDVASVDLNGLALALGVTRTTRNLPVCPSLRYLSVERKGAGMSIDYSRLRRCILSRAKAGCPVFRLRVRTEDWAGMVQVDPGWKKLGTLRGNVSVAFSIPQRSQDMPETTDGFTTILMKKGH